MDLLDERSLDLPSVWSLLPANVRRDQEWNRENGSLGSWVGARLMFRRVVFVKGARTGKNEKHVPWYLSQDVLHIRSEEVLHDQSEDVAVRESSRARTRWIKPAWSIMD